MATSPGAVPPSTVLGVLQRRAQFSHGRAVNVCSFIRNQLPSGQMARVIKLILIFSKKLCLKMENGAVQPKALCRKHERRIGYDAVKDRLARGPQEASWTSNQIITVISISRWDSANNNIYEVISILST